MSAFEGTPLDMALRDCGLVSFMICGIATEIGIDPTVRHGADLGFIPIVIEDACGHGHRDAAERSIENMRYIGDAIVTNIPELRQTLGSMPKDRSSKFNSVSSPPCFYAVQAILQCRLSCDRPETQSAAGEDSAYV